MDGLIPLILDDGPCQVGVESTVVAVRPGAVEVLRPGGVTLEMLSQALGIAVGVARGVDEPVADDERVASPGMLHRHYAPRARMIVVDKPERMLKLYDEEAARGGRPLLLCARQDMAGREGIDLGEHPERELFAALRQSDDLRATLVLFLSVSEAGVGRAVMNRALRAAGFCREG
jgi:L-threonylcarbamoyladenylate synthase